MSNIHLKRLERMRTGGSRDRMVLSFPIPKSPKGRIQRYCPSTGCTPRRFQLGDAPLGQQIAKEHEALVRRQPGTSGVTCPYCGGDSDDQSFMAPEDIEAAKKHIEWAVHQDISDHLDEMARGFNRKKIGSSLVSVSMSVKRSHKPQPYIWRDDLLRGLTCDLCSRAYGVYAIALFCPDCGGRNVHVHFKREVELIEKQVALSEEANTRGDEELAYRILGNAHEDVLTALETYLKALFIFLAKRRSNSETFERLAKEARRGNPFQRVDRASELYGKINIGPFRVLSSDEREFLILHIEKRHVIGHNLGLADEKYLQNVGHGSEGENVRILAEDVRRFARVAYQVIVDGIESSEMEFLPITA